MDLYLDTSALVKLYLNEPHRDVVETGVRDASQVSTSMDAYAEARSAFARRLRENALTREQHDDIVHALNEDWIQLNRVTVTDDIALSAGNVAQRHALRGLDAIHLASAVWMMQFFRDLVFLTFDDRLMQAARQVMPVYDIE